jgi:hypothetical protein
VPGTSDFGTVEPITLVVGFDNSAPARRALTWGADLLRAGLALCTSSTPTTR